MNRSSHTDTNQHDFADDFPEKVARDGLPYAEANGDPHIIARPDHPISRKDIDEDALRILYRLKKNGFEAYVVGGAVRDLLRGGDPKDVDIATNASPWELRELFSNSRLIGRRFRIVHVYYGPKNIEVATLRRQVEVAEGDDDLYLEDDNAWGDVESDAFRRDFTINALFYNIDGFSIIDYTGGVQDIHDKIIRCIGEPAVRFQEDPVRMLRAIKFAARFDFTIEPATHAAIMDYSHEIIKASTPRVTEEFFRIISQKNGEQGLRLLREFGFLDILWSQWLEEIGEDGFEQALDFFHSIETESAAGRYYPLEFVAAGLFLPLLGVIDPADNAYQACASRITSEVRSLADSMDLPKRMAASIVSLLRGQLYLLYFPHRPKNVQRFVENADYDWIWSFHDLAFRDMTALHAIQEVWLRAAEHRQQVGVGWLPTRDQRDVFSFRGKTGGGRHGEGDASATLGSDGAGQGHSSRGSSRRGGRGGRSRRRY